MSTLAQLGALIKRDTQSYLDVSDEEVGRALVLRVKEESSAYNGWSTETLVQSLMRKATEDRGFIVSFFRRKKSESQTKTIEQYTRQIDATIDLAGRQDTLENIAYGRTQVPIERKYAEEKRDVTHQAEMLSAKRKSELERKAFERGRTLETDQQLLVIEETTRISFDDHARRTQLELEKERTATQDKIEMATIARYLEERRQIDLLVKDLHSKYIEVETKKREATVLGAARDRIVASMEKSITALEQEIDAREKRLLQTYSRENGGRMDENPEPQPNVRRSLEKDSDK